MLREQNLITLLYGDVIMSAFAFVVADDRCHDALTRPMNRLRVRSVRGMPLSAR